jgi:hypothetical protein
MFRTEVGEYKGHKTISIFNDDKFVVSFGISKAKAILEVLDDVKEFVEKNQTNSSSKINFDSLTEEQKKAIMQFIKG